MFASFAHHLGAALVLFYRHVAHRAALDEIGVEGYAGLLDPSLPYELPAVQLTGEARVPLELAVAAEVDGAGRTVHTLRLAGLRWAQGAHRLAASPRAPRSALVQFYL